jgi:GT2 family glycosyltransferase
LLIHDNTENNLGFSKAYNKLIAEAIQRGAEYFLVINPDIELMPDALEKLVKEIESDQQLGSVMPKLLRWDFANKTHTQTIDSCGLGLKKGLVFYDIGQAELDIGQYDNSKAIGASGAAALYRISSLQTVAENGNFFDEHFFMYKEDCDLAYRLFLAGFKSKLVPHALGFHDRTVSGGGFFKRLLNRRTHGRNVQKWSFLHQHFLYIKYWRTLSIVSKCFALLRKILMFIEALVFEQYLLGEYSQIRTAKKSLKRY